MARRRRQLEEHHALGPEDDPYLAYLLWREQRDAAVAAPVDDAAPEPPAGRRSWVRRLAVWRRDDSDGAGR